MSGKEKPDLEIFGMEGVPEQDIAAHRAKILAASENSSKKQKVVHPDLPTPPPFSQPPQMPFQPFPFQYPFPYPPHMNIPAQPMIPVAPTSMPYSMPPPNSQPPSFIPQMSAPPFQPHLGPPGSLG